MPYNGESDGLNEVDELKELKELKDRLKKLEGAQKSFVVMAAVYMVLCAAVVFAYSFGRDSGGVRRIETSGQTDAVPVLAQTQEITELININTADKETLMLLEGIDDQLAEKIIAFRSQLPEGFIYPEMLRLVDGVSDELCYRLLEYITV